MIQFSHLRIFLSIDELRKIFQDKQQHLYKFTQIRKFININGMKILEIEVDITIQEIELIFTKNKQSQLIIKKKELGKFYFG